MLKSTLAILFALSSTSFAAGMEKDLKNAIAKDDLSKTEKILTKVGNVDTYIDKANETPLTLAALNGKPRIIKMLLDRKARVNYQQTSGYSALMFAAMGLAEHSDDAVLTIKLLLNSGADKTLKNNAGETALDIAKESRNKDIVALLK